MAVNSSPRQRVVISDDYTSFGTHFMHLQLDFLEARIRVGLSRLSLLNRATTSAKVSNSKFATWTQAQQIVT